MYLGGSKLARYLDNYPFPYYLVVQSVEELPEECDSLYLHDMAVLPEMRGRGVGELLLRRFEEAARARKLAGSHLVAIQGAETFWRRMGYREKPGVDMEKLAGYGTAAFLMAKAF